VIHTIKQCILYSWLSSFFLTFASSASAQIVPDSTLPVNSIVTPQGNTQLIDGGTVAGSNLFHSFQQFSVLSGETASFNNSLNIQNILTRVTGNSASNIDGLLQAKGNANLFLINPNGVIFGRNATLNIGGSFIGSTESTSLLSITVPLGLQFPGIPANITSGATNLQVAPGKTLALIGGNLTLEGSQLTAPQGRVELGAVGGGNLGNNFVSLNPTTNGWTVGYEGINNFSNIQLLSQSQVATNGTNSGNIQVQGADVTLTDNSKITANNSGNLDGGEILVKFACYKRFANCCPSFE
jgi:filamentous hemagglutinin family protein